VLFDFAFIGSRDRRFDRLIAESSWLNTSLFQVLSCFGAFIFCHLTSVSSCCNVEPAVRRLVGVEVLKGLANGKDAFTLGNEMAVREQIRLLRLALEWESMDL
jgi:hypothetical protein